MNDFQSMIYVTEIWGYKQVIYKAIAKLAVYNLLIEKSYIKIFLQSCTMSDLLQFKILSSR
jgi:hypothetical protein